MIEKFKLTEPTFFFIGVTTSGSLSTRLFPVWLEVVGLPKTAIRGIDIEVRGPEAAGSP